LVVGEDRQPGNGSRDVPKVLLFGNNWDQKEAEAQKNGLGPL
jgi:hypothetical protein